MVIQTRFRSIFIAVALFFLTGAAGAYFVWHALNGERGLNAKVAYEAKIKQLTAELNGLVAARERLERRVGMMQTDQVERDLLEEEARLVLGRVGKSDLVVLTTPE
jgi:hypothetical protein